MSADMNERLIQANAMAEELKSGITGEIHGQESIAWLYDRLGFCTASRFADAMDFTAKGLPGAKRKKYIIELVTSRLTGKPVEHYVSNDMLRGTELEPLARMAYEGATGFMVEETGFIRHLTLPWVGCSPDGLLSSDGGIEIKCLRPENHISVWLSDGCEYLPQIQGCMWVTGRQWWDWVCFDPDAPPHLRLFVRRIVRDDAFIADMAIKVQSLLDEVAEMESKLRQVKQLNPLACLSNQANGP